MEKIVRLAKDVVLRQGYHVPQLVFSGEQGGGAVMMEDFPNEYEEKIAFLFYAGKYASSKNPVGKLNKVFLVMEAWMVKLQKGEKITPARNHPRRIEVLIISCLDVLTKEQKVTTLEYVRDEHGVLREIKDVDLPHGTTAESPLLPAFVAGYMHR